MTQILTLKPGELTLAQLRAVANSHIKIQLEETVYKRMAQSEKIVQKIIAENKTVYGINTGFGELAKISINPEELGRLQRHIVLSHATGVGEYLKDNIVRLILLLKINALAQGYSGICRKVLDALKTMYNEEIYPCIPSKGSVGASGDLAPLAHLTMPILGVGKVR